MDDTKRAISNQSIDGTSEAVLSRVEELESKVEAQGERIENLEAENKELRGTVEALSQGNSHAHERIDDIESGEGASSAPEGGVKAGETSLKAAENPPKAEELTPLGEIVNLPEWMADEQLSSNQQRARFVAKDIRQYGDMRLGDLVISSGDIRKVLSAKEQGSVHWQTVKRVIEYLDGMGKDVTRVKDKHGTIVCFDPEAVDRWGETHTVVSGEKGEV